MRFGDCGEFCGSFGLGLLPTLGPADAPNAADMQLAAQKYPMYRNPAQYGITLNDEGIAFDQAITRGFVDDSVEGLAQFLAWVSRGTRYAIANDQYDWYAFQERWIGKVPASVLPALPGKVASWGGDPARAQQALEAEYAVAFQPYGPPPSSITPAPTPAPVLRKIAQLVLTKSVPPAPGDGIHFPTLAWRTLDQNVQTLQYANPSAWTRWTNGVVNRLSSADTMLVFIEDIGPGDTFYDWPGLQRVLAMGGTGSPPPASLGADVIAAPTSTSLDPVTLPAGTTPLAPPVIPSAVPSGTEPPSVKPWVDVAVTPPPPSGASPDVAPASPAFSFGPTPPAQPVTFGADEPDTPIRRPEDALPALGTGALLLAAAGLLMLFGRRRR